jgi:hypothetical protein
LPRRCPEFCNFMTAVPDPILANFSATRAALEHTAATVSSVLDIGSFLVVLGVAVELIALILEIKEGKRLAAPAMLNLELATTAPRKYRVSAPTILSFIGCALVAVGVAAELWATHRGGIIEGRLRKTNASEQLELIGRSNKATEKAAALEERVGGFDALIKQTDAKLDVAMATASDQKARSAAIIASLNQKQKEVEAIIGAAKKDEVELSAAANTITELRQQLRELTADRTIDVNRIAEKLKGFAKTAFVLAVSDDRDASLLCVQIASALEQAGWIWQENKGSGGARELVKPACIQGKPNMRGYIGRGVRIDVADRDIETFRAAQVTLSNALIDERLNYVELRHSSDDVMNLNRNMYGVITIDIGLRF